MRVLVLALQAVLCLTGILSGTLAQADDALEVLLVRPDAQNVVDVRQITVTFNKPMVPLGDYEKLAGNFKIDVTPKIDCQWRWLNASTIACQLNQTLPPSNVYKINVPAGLKALDGAELRAAVTAEFTTQLWQVVHKELEWKGPDEPLIYLSFNQPMDLKSLGAKTTSECGRVIVSTIKDQLAVELNVDASRTYLFSLEKPVGIGRDCALTIKGEAKAAAGNVPSGNYSFSFQSYPTFAVSQIHCVEASDGHKRISASKVGNTFELGKCNPDYGLSIDLNTPTTGKNLSGKVQVEPHFGWSPGSEGSPEYFKQYGDQEHDRIYLRSPMQGAGNHIVKLVGLKDRFGRPLTGPSELRVATGDFTPLLQLPDGYGVLEKDGPRQLGLSGVNGKEVDLKYFHSNRLDDVDMWSSYNVCSAYDPKHRKPFVYENQLKKTVLSAGTERNQPFSAPIDLPKIAPDFKQGMFVGIMEEGHELSGAPFKAHRICSNFFTVVTDIGLMAKVGFYESAIWAHSIRTGEPLKGVRVGLYDGSKAIFEGTTDNEGFLAGPGAQKWDPERSRTRSWGGPSKLYVAGQTNDDFSMLPFEVGHRGLEYYQFGSTGHHVGSHPLTEGTNHIVHAITDRPLYKPGQKVNVKLFARHWEPRTYGMRPARELEIIVRDALDKQVLIRKVKLSEFGTANFEFDLDAASPLGSYQISAKIDQFRSHVGQFDVQVFTLPAFKVKVEPRKESFEVGDSANFATAARYHFGGGVPNATGAYTVNFTPGYWRPTIPKWESYTFENAQDLSIVGWERPRAQTVTQVAAGEVTTDKNGDSHSGILLPEDQLKTYGKLEYGVQFKDDRGKAIAGYGTTKVFYSRYQVGIKTPKWTYEAREEIKPEVIVLDRDEKPVAGVDVTLKLVHRTYKTVRRHGEGSYFYYDTRTKDREIARCTFKSGDSAKGCGLKSIAAGSHFIVASARDSRGRLSQAALDKYVLGKEYVGWYRENHDRIDVIPDKQSYNVGETVKLLVKNPYPEVDAIITLERFGILKKFKHRLTKGAELISIALDEKDYAPGFFVSVHLVKGRVSEKIEGGVDLGKPSFKMGLAKITVVDPDTVLKVTAKASEEQYEPGAKAEVSLSVSSPAGSDGAELSVAVVDEKILQLAGDYEGRYKLHEKFYSLRGGDVQTAQMLSFLIGRRHFGKKGAPAGGDGDGENKVRKNILPLAYWNPALKTGKNGKAEVTFTLPDNLTTWRVLVVAVDKQHRFGFGSGTFRASKKLMVEPALPSFLTEGDKVNARFTLFNRTGKKTGVEARLTLTGAELVGSDERKADVVNDGKTWLEWPVKAPFGQNSAVFEVKASGGGAKDGIRETVPIYPYASYETFANYGSTTESDLKEALLVPQGIRPELGGFEIVASPTLISHLDETFRYLFAYPYTCWEQTLDRALALSQYLRLKEYLSIPELERDPKGWAADLLAEMPRFQFENGGMAFWKPSAETVDPYLSVFTAMGLQWLRETKHKAPSDSETKVFGYVRRLVQGTEQIRYGSARSRATVLAMAAHVLARDGEDMVSTINKLYQERQNLSLFGKSFLWMAASKRPETKPLLDSLKKEIYAVADLTSGSIQFKEEHDDGFVEILHSTTRTNCSLLDAMLEEDPKGKFVEPLVRWIIAGRKSGRWNNTQENIFCQNALAKYSKFYEKDSPDFAVTGEAMGKELKKFSFQTFRAEPHAEKLQFVTEAIGKKTELKLKKKGKGRLYYTARMRIAYKDVRTTSVNSGMQVERTYYVKGGDGKWQKASSTVKLKRGQLVKVELKVNIPAVRHHVVLDDRLPAGLEPLNTALGGTSKTDAASGEKNETEGQYFWNEDDDWYGFYQSGGFYHREIRLHAVQYFSKFMSAGDYTLAYVAQAIATGEFNANPALIEQMYEPEVYGKSTPAQFIIED